MRMEAHCALQLQNHPHVTKSILGHSKGQKTIFGNGPVAVMNLTLHTPNYGAVTQILAVMGTEGKQLLQFSRLSTHTKIQQ